MLARRARRHIISVFSGSGGKPAATAHLHLRAGLRPPARQGESVPFSLCDRSTIVLAVKGNITLDCSARLRRSTPNIEKGPLRASRFG